MPQLCGDNADCILDALLAGVDVGQATLEAEEADRAFQEEVGGDVWSYSLFVCAAASIELQMTDRSRRKSKEGSLSQAPHDETREQPTSSQVGETANFPCPRKLHLVCHTRSRQRFDTIGCFVAFPNPLKRSLREQLLQHHRCATLHGLPRWRDFGHRRDSVHSPRYTFLLV